MWSTLYDFRTLLSLFSPRVKRSDDFVSWNSRRDWGKQTERSWVFQSEKEWELGSKWVGWHEMIDNRGSLGEGNRLWDAVKMAGVDGKLWRPRPCHPHSSAKSQSITGCGRCWQFLGRWRREGASPVGLIPTWTKQKGEHKQGILQSSCM